MDREQISAMADGNVSDEECSQLSSKDMALLDTYQMIGDLIRASEPVRPLSSGFAARMAQRLAQEMPHSPSRSEIK